MVGGEVLQYCLNHSEITHVVTIGRKHCGVKHPKHREVEHQNFLNFTNVETELENSDLCFYCVGVYQGQVSKEAFWEITADYFSALLRSIEEVNPSTRLCLFSAQGADPLEKSLARFANAKGRAEAMLTESTVKHQYVFRPGYIAPRKNVAQNMMSIRLFKPIYKLLPFIGIDAPDLAKVMVDIGLASGPNNVFENTEMRRLGHQKSQLNAYRNPQ